MHKLAQTKRWALGGAVIFMMFALACSAEAAAPPEPTATPRVLPESTITETSGRIFLIAPVGDFQEGWADLTETPDGLRVELDVDPGESFAQPAHIHLGDCGQLGDVFRALENVVAGNSVTVFEDLAITDIATGGMAINIHKSFADFPTYTACGEIPALS